MGGGLDGTSGVGRPGGLLGSRRLVLASAAAPADDDLEAGTRALDALEKRAESVDRRLFSGDIGLRYQLGIKDYDGGGTTQRIMEHQAGIEASFIIRNFKLNMQFLAGTMEGEEITMPYSSLVDTSSLQWYLDNLGEHMSESDRLYLQRQIDHWDENTPSGRGTLFDIDFHSHFETDMEYPVRKGGFTFTPRLTFSTDSYTYNRSIPTFDPMEGLSSESSRGSYTNYIPGGAMEFSYMFDRVTPKLSLQPYVSGEGRYLLSSGEGFGQLKIDELTGRLSGLESEFEGNAAWHESNQTAIDNIGDGSSDPTGQSAAEKARLEAINGKLGERNTALDSELSGLRTQLSDIRDQADDPLYSWKAKAGLRFMMPGTYGAGNGWAFSPETVDLSYSLGQDLISRTEGGLRPIWEAASPRALRHSPAVYWNPAFTKGDWRLSPKLYVEPTLTRDGFDSIFLQTGLEAQWKSLRFGAGYQFYHDNNNDNHLPMLQIGLDL